MALLMISGWTLNMKGHQLIVLTVNYKVMLRANVETKVRNERLEIQKEEAQKEIILKAKEVIDDDGFLEVTRKKSRKSNKKKATMVTKVPVPLQNNKSTYHVNTTYQETSKTDTDQSIAPEIEIQETNKEVQQLRVHNQQAKKVKEKIEQTRASIGP